MDEWLLLRLFEKTRVECIGRILECKGCWVGGVGVLLIVVGFLVGLDAV